MLLKEVNYPFILPLVKTKKQEGMDFFSIL